MISKNRIFSVIVCEVIGYHRVGNVVILVENVNADIHVRIFSENIIDSVENIFGDRKHPFVFQYDNTPAHTAYWTVTFLEQQDISTIQWPSQPRDLNAIKQVRDFMGIPVTRNDLIRALHNTWLNITVPYLRNPLQLPSWRVRAVIRGQGYPTKYWLNVCSQQGHI